MPERWIGLVVGSSQVILVDAEVQGSGPIVIQADDTWPLQKGDRASAYSVIFQQLADYARENRVSCVVIKASAVSLGGTKKVHLEAAELRGVVMCAAASVTATKSISKAVISRTFGSRKVDDYIQDSAFWSKEAIGASLRKGSREAAMVLLAARK